MKLTKLPPPFYFLWFWNRTYEFVFVFEVQKWSKADLIDFRIVILYMNSIPAFYLILRYNTPWGVKGGWRVRLTTLPPSVSRLSREDVGASMSHNPMGLHGPLQG
jgi:hypothetical protein